MPNLFSGLAGRDLGVGPRVDVGIDAQRNVGAAALGGGDGREQFKLGLGLDVDAEDAGIDGCRELGSVLPMPENMIFSGGTPARSARCSSPPETTSAPAPRFARVLMTAWLEFAFMA